MMEYGKSRTTLGAGAGLNHAALDRAAFVVGTLIVGALAAGALATASPAAAQAVTQTETFQLAEVAGSALPALIEEEDGCREEVLSGTLTLEPDGSWLLVTREREVCGETTEEEEEREDGTYVVDGDTIRFGEDDDDDAGDDRGAREGGAADNVRGAREDGAAGDDARARQPGDDLDIDDLVTATRTADGLSATVEGGVLLVFRR